ncbi:MAG: Lrp/AsnC family transcriptional regulator [Halobacteria archaeon]|nr:Lrp/AsnC family transcriptional regulator [Halobacteria archaeon]
MSEASTEERILKVLEDNAKASYGEIANVVGVSKPTVRKYIEKLEEEGTILGYSAEVDPKKLGGRTVSLVGIDSESDQFLNVVSEIKELDEVKKLYISSGDHDLMAEVAADDNSSLHEVISNITDIEGVEASHPSVLQERVK